MPRPTASSRSDTHTDSVLGGLHVRVRLRDAIEVRMLAKKI